MTTPKDLIPQQYEVLKLRSGNEVVGMTRDTEQGIEITLPMICRLELLQNQVSTLATFYPYAPMSQDPVVVLPYDMIVHRNIMNDQFVPFYDEASSRWAGMVENGTIPLTSDRNVVRKEFMDKIVHDLMEATGGPITEQEERMLQRLEEEEWTSEDETFAEFEHAIKPRDKKKIH